MECDLSDTTGSLNGGLATDVYYDYYEKGKNSGGRRGTQDLFGRDVRATGKMKIDPAIYSLSARPW